MALSDFFDMQELGTLFQLVEEKAQAELASVRSRLEGAVIGELSSLFSEGLSVANKWEAMHAKLQSAASASAPAPQEPASAPEAPAPVEAAPEASLVSDPSEAETVALPAVSVAEELPAAEAS